MASLWKHPQSKYWVACFTDATGRQRKRSTGTTSRKEAEGLAHTFEAEARRIRTATQARRVLADLYREVSGQTIPTATVEGYFDAFVERKKPEVSASTFSYYKGNAKRFLRWLGDRAKADIATVTKSDITAFRNDLAKQTGTATVNNSLKAVKTFFASARKDGFLVDDPAADVDTIRDRSESPRRPFTLKEIQSVLALATPEWRTMILLGLYTGQRLGDVAALTWGNIDLDRAEIRLTTKKTGRRIVLPMASPLADHLRKIRPEDPPPKTPICPDAVATMTRNGDRAGPLSKQFGALLRRAKLRDDDTEAPDGGARAKFELSFHSLRHTATSLLKEAGIPQSVVLAYIGHESDAVSAGYTHTGREALEKAAAVLPIL